MSKHGETPHENMADDVGRDLEGMTKEELEAELDKQLYEVEKRIGKETSESPEVRAAEKTIGEVEQTIDQRMENVLWVDEQDSKYDKPSKDVESFDSSKKSEDLTKATEEAQRQREEEIGMVDRTIRFFTRAKGISFLLGIVTTIGIVGAFAMAIAAYAKAGNDGTPPPEPDPLGLTPDQRKNIETLITHWWKMDDTQLWNQIVTFCDQFNPSLQAQVLLMDQIKELSKATETSFYWASEDDKWAAIQTLVTAYAQCIPEFQQSKSRALYITIQAYSYSNRAHPEQSPAFPRQVAADLVELALYQIINIPTQPAER